MREFGYVLAALFILVRLLVALIMSSNSSLLVNNLQAYHEPYGVAHSPTLTSTCSTEKIAFSLSLSRDRWSVDMAAHSSILLAVLPLIHLDLRVSNPKNTAAVLVMIAFEDISGSSGWYATILSFSERYFSGRTANTPNPIHRGLATISCIHSWWK